MNLRSRSFWGVVLGLVLTYGGFRAVADPDVRQVRGRYGLGAIPLGQDWSPPAPHGEWHNTIGSRTEAPQLKLSFPAPDAYRLRIFYRLEGDSPGDVLVGGVRSARLDPGKWRRATVRSPLVPKGESLNLSFRVPKGGRLILRRVDYANYLTRLGGFLLLKPAGAAGVPATPAQAGVFLLAYVLLLGAGVSLANPGSGGREGLLRSVCLEGGGAGALLLLQGWLSPYPIHTVPHAAGVLLLAVAGGPIVRRLAGGGGALIRKAGLAAAGAGLALVVAEGILWVWDPPISRPRVGSYFVYSPRYGWLNRPGAQGWQVGVGYHIRINGFGHRGGTYPEKKPGGVFRILGLGDSFGFGWGVEEKDTFFRVLERRLREAGHNVQVINASVAGWHSSQALEYLVHDGLCFEPDLVLVEFFMDDVFFHTVEELRKSLDAMRIRNDEAEARRRRATAATRSRLYNLWFNYRKIRRAVREHQWRNPFPSFEAEREKILSVPSHKDVERNPAARENLEKMIRKWEAARKSHKLPIVFTFVPAGGALGHPELQGHARLLRQVGLAHGISFIDVIPALERQPDTRKLYLHPADGHMSAFGHHAVGDHLAGMILKGNWLKAAGR